MCVLMLLLAKITKITLKFFNSFLVKITNSFHDSDCAFQAGTLLACPHCSVILAQFPWQRSVLLNYMIVESKCVMSSVNTHLTLVQHVGSISFLSFLPFSIAFFTCPPCLYLSLSLIALSLPVH